MLTHQETGLQEQADAPESLARLINDDLHVMCDCGCVRVAVEPRELRIFIKNNWERVARYAHLIHRAK